MCSCFSRILIFDTSGFSIWIFPRRWSCSVQLIPIEILWEAQTLPLCPFFVGFDVPKTTISVLSRLYRTFVFTCFCCKIYKVWPEHFRYWLCTRCVQAFAGQYAKEQLIISAPTSVCALVSPLPFCDTRLFSCLPRAELSEEPWVDFNHTNTTGNGCGGDECRWQYEYRFVCTLGERIN